MKDAPATTPTYQLFLEDGSPRLRGSAVLFLDLLGTSKERSDEEAQEHLIATRKALANARHWGGSEIWDQHTSVSSWFSDNLGLAFPLHGALDMCSTVGLCVTSAAAHQLSLALDGMFARGAISFGYFFADRNFMAGPALNEAVRLEKAAFWPRVALDEAAVAIAYKGLIDQEFSGPDAAWRGDLVCDEKDEVFVNYLSAVEPFLEEIDRVRNALALHRDKVRANLAAGHPSGIEKKYRYLAAYHDHYVGGLDQRYVEDLYVEAKAPLGEFRPFGHDVPVPENGDW